MPGAAKGRFRRQPRARDLAAIVVASGTILGVVLAIRVGAGGGLIPVSENAPFTVAQAFSWTTVGCSALATPTPGVLLPSGEAVPVATNVSVPPGDPPCRLLSVQAVDPNFIVTTTGLPLTIPSGNTSEVRVNVLSTSFVPPSIVELQLNAVP